MCANPAVIGNTPQEIQYHEAGMKAMLDFYNAQPEQMMLKSGRWIPVSQGNVDQYASLSGSVVIDQQSGKQVKEFEYSSKSLANIVSAVGR